MTVRLAAISVDCADALVVARFWATALGRPLDPKPSSEFASIGMPEHRDPQGVAPRRRPDLAVQQGA